MATANREKSAETKRPRGRPFEPGNRANPSGRPKDTDEVKQAKEEMRKALLPGVLRMKEALADPDTKLADVIKIVEILCDRVLGKAAQPIVADIFQAEKPLTIDECFAIAEEVLRDSEAGGTTAP